MYINLKHHNYPAFTYFRHLYLCPCSLQGFSYCILIHHGSIAILYKTCRSLVRQANRQLSLEACNYSGLPTFVLSTLLPSTFLPLSKRWFNPAPVCTHPAQRERESAMENASVSNVSCILVDKLLFLKIRLITYAVKLDFGP